MKIINDGSDVLYLVPNKFTGDATLGIPVEFFDVETIDFDEFKKNLRLAIVSYTEKFRVPPTKDLVVTMARSLFTKYIG